MCNLKGLAIQPLDLHCPDGNATVSSQHVVSGENSGLGILRVELRLDQGL